ncbi:unnamed protein product [Clonostachys rosea]|uniref:F-box domain-containing protein n=1 Tax=Bionectria ochroleuca TaxID=29856 RepID=A0ABY6TPG2_BIOOC|nr:unnamed protein product [Clonostachys rosea]
MTKSEEMAFPALTRALNMIEIFEAILLYLDIADLLRIQGVSKFFKNTIAESSSIQQKLFFKPVPESSKCPPELNPLMAELFPALFTLNKPPCPTSLAYLRPSCGLDWLSDASRCEKMLYPDASWRRMFPVQPPAKLETITINRYDSCVRSACETLPTRIGSKHQHLQEPGIKMGLLFDLLVRMDMMHPHTAFFVHWQMFSLENGTDVWNEEYDEEDGEWGLLGYWRVTDYYPLFSPDNDLELTNSITLYLTHDSLCGGGFKPWPFKLDSPFHTAIENDPKSMLEYTNDPGTYAIRWKDFGKVVGRADTG